MDKYDYLIVGAGLFGSVFAHEMTQRGKSCLVIDKRPHIGGNCYCRKQSDIAVHEYGPHIFHTNDERVWSYVNRFVEFNGFINSPIAVYQGKAYNLPFNMNTFCQLWGHISPTDAKEKIRLQVEKLIGKPVALNIVEVKSVDTNAQLEAAENIHGMLEPEEAEELEALRRLKPDDDIEGDFNFLATHVWFKSNGPAYRRYLPEAVDEFEDNVGFFLTGGEEE